jgi:hypothetical protein
VIVRPRPAALVVALALAAWSMVASAQGTARRFEAESAEAVGARETRVGDWTWRCDRRRCTASGPATRLTPVDCAQVSAAIGPLVRFGHDRGRLDIAQLAECNRLGARVQPTEPTVVPVVVPAAAPLVQSPSAADIGAAPGSPEATRPPIRRVITGPLIFHGQAID